MNDLQKKTKKGVVFFICCLSFSIIAAVLNFLLLKNGTVTQIGESHRTVLYNRGALMNVSIALTVAFVVALLSALYFFRKTPVLKPGKAGRSLLLFAQAAAGLSLVFVLLMQFILASDGTPYAPNDNDFSLRNTWSMQKISLALAAVGSAYFFIPLFTEKKSRGLSAAQTACGILLTFFFCTQLLVTHDYMNDFLNSPTRVYSICSYCVLIFFFLAEMRLGLKNRSMPGTYTAFGLVAFFITFVETVPKLVLSFMNEAGYSVGIDNFY